MAGLKFKGVHPSAPTLIAFWEENCSDCEANIRYFPKLPSSVRTYTIHLQDNSLTESDIKQKWISLNPGASQMIFDETEILQTSFKVRGGAMVFLILPKEKAIYSYFGKIADNNEKLEKIIQESYQ